MNYWRKNLLSELYSKYNHNSRANLIIEIVIDSFDYSLEMFYKWIKFSINMIKTKGKLLFIH